MLQFAVKILEVDLTISLVLKAKVKVMCKLNNLISEFHYIFVGLIICSSDCLLSAEWVSSNKIVARSGPGKSKGDIIVITKSGGKGSCTVQFRGYHETIGPLKESAVWVDESHLTGLGRHRALIPSSFQQDDPLGLSVENAVYKIVIYT